MRILGRLVFATFAALLSASAVQAADVEGSSDHPLVGRYEGSEIVGYEVTAYDETTLVEGPFSPTSTTGGTGFKTTRKRDAPTTGASS